MMKEIKVIDPKPLQAFLKEAPVGSEAYFFCDSHQQSRKKVLSCMASASIARKNNNSLIVEVKTFVMIADTNTFKWCVLLRVKG